MEAGHLKVALDKRTAMERSAQLRAPPGPSLKWGLPAPSPQVPLTKRHPQFPSLSSDAQAEPRKYWSLKQQGAGGVGRRGEEGKAVHLAFSARQEQPRAPR